MKNSPSRAESSSCVLLIRILCALIGMDLALPYSAAQSLGPHQPEFSSFAPAERREIVDPFTGDLRYGIPLFDVPGPSGSFPLTLSYQSGISPDQDATWVGLGWTLNPGAIVRQVRGLPDDFDGESNCSSGLQSGDCVATTEDIQPNWTFGLGLDANVELFGLDSALGLGLSAGFKGYFNSYRGLGYTQSIGVSGQETSSGIDAAVGLNLSLDSQEGLRASPSLSLANTLNVSADLDAVHGLSTLNLGVDYRDYLHVSTDLLSFLGYSKPTSLPGAGRDMKGWNIKVALKGGGDVQGVFLNLQGSGFYTIEQVANPNERFNPAVGYLHLDKALSASDDVRAKLLLDFNREHDGAIYDDSPNLAAPVLTHDLYVASGPDLAGTFRAYRNDVPMLFDTQQGSDLLGGVIGLDIGGGLIAKFGASGSLNGTKSLIGGWDGGNSGALQLALKSVTPAPGAADPRWERSYFKMIGEPVQASPATALPGGESPVAIPVKAAPFDINNLPPDFFTAESQLTSNGNDRIPIALDESGRAPRGTLIEAFTNEQLDQQSAAFPEFAISRNGIYSGRRPNHIGGFRVTLPDGRRLIYAIPVYNTVHEEHEFSVARTDFAAGANCQIVVPPPSGNIYQYQVDGTEQYHHIKKLSPYATAYVLTAILGPDYIDADGTPGPTDGDFGYWVRFDYENEGDFPWRRPYYGARFIRGHDNGVYVLGKQRRGDKAYVTYGKREEWYLKEIHTQTHYAKFLTSTRADGHAAPDAGGVTSNQASNLGPASRRLDSIELYGKDRTQSTATSTFFKTVHFSYDYSLMKGAPGGTTSQTGRLTLKRVWTTFGSNTRGTLSPDEFDYDENTAGSNPNYAWAATDRWGTYRTPLTALSQQQCEQAGAASDPTIRANTPYTRQDSQNNNAEAAAWSLRSIVEPSGREIKIQYEADDYSYVQDRPATGMVQIAAVNDPTGAAGQQATINGTSHTDANSVDPLRVYFKVDPSATAASVKHDYLRGDQRIYFRIRVALKDGVTDPVHGNWETVSGYANMLDAGVMQGPAGQTLGWVQLERVQGFHPFSVAAWQYLRLVQPDLISSSAINGDPSASAFDEAAKILTMADFLEEIVNMAKGVYQTWFDRKWGQQLDLENSWLRLHVPNGVKIGGGARVHQIAYSDRWNAATGGVEPDALTGRVFEYRLADGTSSGVAAYEPAEGADENAVRDAKPFTQKVLLSSDYRLFSELPALEAYYPAPTVGYSRVTERTLASEQARDRARAGNIPTRTSTAGPTVYEYYTARDFPVQTNETPIVKKRNPEPNMVPIPFLGMITLKSLVASQGYSVVLNDMHGKLRSVTHYEYGQAWDAAKQDSVIRDMPMNSTQYSYRVTGGEGGQSMKLKETLPVLEADAVRAQADPSFAREAELFLDTRRNRTESWEVGLNVNVDLTYAVFPIPIIVPIPSFSYSLSEAKTLVAAKVVHQSGVLDKVVQTMGPTRTTRSNHLFDPMSGRALLSSATNAFGDPLYSYQLPARWMYPRMGAAFSSSGLKLPLTGAQLADPSTLQIAQPAIPACADDPVSPAPTAACLPLGSHFVAGTGAAATTLVLTAADPTTGITLKSSQSLMAAPTGDATLVQSGNQNELDTDAGTIQALQDPTLKRGQGTCSGLGVGTSENQAIGTGNNFSPPQTVSGILSASARVFTDNWDSIKDDMWFFGSGTSITQQRTAYGARDDFATGLRGGWRPAADFVYVEKRDQASGIDTRKDGTFLLQMFDWKDQKYFPFCEPKWEVKSLVTRYAPPDAPTEELNAAGIPTSALYAFGRSVPVAIGDNAMHDEIAFESFESFPRNKPVQIEQSGEGNYLFRTDMHRYKIPAPQCPIVVKTPATWLRNILKINERNLPAFVQGLPGPGIPPEPPGDPFALQGVTVEIAGEACTLPVTSVRAMGNGEYGFGLDTAHPICASAEHAAGQPAARRRSPGTTMQPPELVGRPVTVIINFDCRQRHPTYVTRRINLSTVKAHTGTQSLRVELNEDFMQVKVRPRNARTYVVSAWVSRDDTDVPTFDTAGDLGIQIKYWQNGQEMTAQRPALIVPSGPVIAGWQRVEGQFQAPAGAESLSIALQYGKDQFAPGAYFDDIRVVPLDARLETYVYDPATMRIGAKLDNNNFATFYGYQADGSLQQTQRETPHGLLTSAEGRTHPQERP